MTEGLARNDRRITEGLARNDRRMTEGLARNDDTACSVEMTAWNSQESSGRLLAEGFKTENGIAVVDDLFTMSYEYHRMTW